ncbi:hypothetical protein ACIQAC_01190 [Streptomyces sp. NPDC088387]|uniref:hypothetical protein n=1 Tax=Streptomyces sp. NPDC088387 TaxID=3365859 RepID=UPI00380C4056
MKLTKPPKDPEARARIAEKSAGRAGGYCWIEHPDGGSFCTLHPGHEPDLHFNFYIREEFR